MISTSISLTLAAAFGVGLWLILPLSVKFLAELFQLLLLCHIAYLMGRVSALNYLIATIENFPEYVKDWLDED